MGKKTEIPSTLSKQEADFCELYVLGCAPYTGNAKKCHEDVFKSKGPESKRLGCELLMRDDVSEYVSRLNKLVARESSDIKSRLTENLTRIMEETATAVYRDKRNIPLSPAPLRSVSVMAAKALMEMYPVKVAQENKLELSAGKDGENGITLNFVMPKQEKPQDNA